MFFQFIYFYVNAQFSFEIYLSKNNSLINIIFLYYFQIAISNGFNLKKGRYSVQWARGEVFNHFSDKCCTKFKVRLISHSIVLEHNEKYVLNNL